MINLWPYMILSLIFIIVSILCLKKISKTLHEIVFSVIFVLSVTYFIRLGVIIFGVPFNGFDGEEIAILAGLAAMAIGLLHIILMGKETHDISIKTININKTLGEVGSTQKALSIQINRVEDTQILLDQKVESTQIALSKQIKQVEDTQKLLDQKADERLNAVMNLSDYLKITSSFYTDKTVDLVITHITVWQMQLEKDILNSQAVEIMFIGDITNVSTNNIEGVLWRINRVEEANAIRKGKGYQEIVFNNLKLHSPGFVYAEKNGKVEILIRALDKNDTSSKAFGFHLNDDEFQSFLSSMKNVLIPESSHPVHAHIAFLQLIKDKIQSDIINKFRKDIVDFGFQEAITSFIDVIAKEFNLQSFGKNELTKFFTNCMSSHSEDLYNYLIDLFPYNNNLPVLHSSIPDEEIVEAKTNNKLLRLAIETWTNCNFHCVYCYAGNNTNILSKSDNDIVRDTKRIIDEAEKLGVKVISLLGGGEPFVDRKKTNSYMELVNYIVSKDIDVVIFTNGYNLTEELVDELSSVKKNITFIVKLHSLSNAFIHDNLCLGDNKTRLDCHAHAKKTLELLIEFGFNKSEDDKHTTHLAIESVIVKDNIGEIPKLWEWARQSNIFPYIELTKFQGNAQSIRDRLIVDQSQVKNLFMQLKEIDKKRGLNWTLSSPFPGGMQCRMFHIGAYINYQGNVQPCVGITEKENPYNVFSEGNSLKGAIESERFKIYRDIKKQIHGKCKDCPEKLCYGCRAHGFWDPANESIPEPERVLMEDSMCPRNFTS